jgi:hypothetical protein
VASEQICPACATINSTAASTCTGCSTPLSRPDEPKAVREDGAPAVPAPAAIRPEKGFRIFEGSGLAAPHDAPGAVSVAEPTSAPVALSVVAPVATPMAARETPSEAFEPAPKLVPPVNSGWPAKKPTPSSLQSDLPTLGWAELTSPASAGNGHGQGDGNGGGQAARDSMPAELTFAIDGTVVDPPAAAASPPPAPPGQTAHPNAAPTAPAPLAFHVDHASVPPVPPLTMEPAVALAPAGDGEDAGGRGWGVREQRPNPAADWNLPQPAERDDDGPPAAGVPRVHPARKQAAAPNPGSAIPAVVPNREGTIRVLRVGSLVLLMVLVIFGALIYFGGR